MGRRRNYVLRSTRLLCGFGKKGLRISRKWCLRRTEAREQVPVVHVTSPPGPDQRFGNGQVSVRNGNVKKRRRVPRLTVVLVDKILAPCGLECFRHAAGTRSLVASTRSNPITLARQTTGTQATLRRVIKICVMSCTKVAHVIREIGV